MSGGWFWFAVNVFRCLEASLLNFGLRRVVELCCGNPLAFRADTGRIIFSAISSLPEVSWVRNDRADFIAH